MEIIEFGNKTTRILKLNSLASAGEVAALKQELSDMNGYKEVFVDLSNVVSVNDDFINALITVRVEQFKSFRRITLVNPSEIVGKMLEAGQIDQLYKVRRIHSTAW